MRFLVPLILGAVLACASPTDVALRAPSDDPDPEVGRAAGPNTIVRVEVVPDSVVLSLRNPYDTTLVVAYLWTARGTLPSKKLPVTWVARDPGVVQVLTGSPYTHDSYGAKVLDLALGTTWVVATYEGLSDSLKAVVVP